VPIYSLFIIADPGIHVHRRCGVRPGQVEREERRALFENYLLGVPCGLCGETATRRLGIETCWQLKVAAIFQSLTRREKEFK
jgi:hypothetical protein